MPNRTEVSVDVTLEPSDFYSPLHRTWRNLIHFVLVLCSALLWRETWRDWSWPYSAINIGSMALLVMSFAYPWMRVRHRFRKFSAMGKSRRFTFDAEGLHIQSENASGDYRWSTVARVVETPRLFIFKFAQTNRGGRTIPKRCFKHLDDIPRLRQLLRENFNGNLRLRAD